MKDGKKQIYGLAFCIYAMTAYYKAAGNTEALQQAKNLYNLIEQYSYDRERGGYFEAFTREWEPIGDLRLSEKDANEKKTMNTHLHVIEAYTSLYEIWKDERLKSRITGLLDVFDKYIINKKNHHLNLFMDEDWQVKSTTILFGHDIEAAWLLLEAAEATGEKPWIEKYKKWAVKIADAASKGRDTDGGLWYEYEPDSGHWTREKHSWPQAEAMVGYLNAYRLTGNMSYLDQSYQSWRFIDSYILDKEKGEWFWGVKADHSPMAGQDKAGFWKCPYHNTRACLEVIKRIKNLA